jgi:hypothetical protein
MAKNFGLTLPEAIERLEQTLEVFRKDTDRNQVHLSPDEAFDEGYALCLEHLKSLTGPDPKEDGAVERLRRVDPAAAKELEDRYR